MWQVIQKCPFLDPLWQLVERRVSFCIKAKHSSTQTIYETIMVDDINLPEPWIMEVADQVSVLDVQRLLA
jgi:hypothetical protein